MRRSTLLLALVTTLALLSFADSASAHYNPTMGRWVERDPVGYRDGMGLYEYCRSMPPSGLDSSGLDLEGSMVAKANMVANAQTSQANSMPTQSMVDVGGYLLVMPIDENGNLVSGTPRHPIHVRLYAQPMPDRNGKLDGAEVAHKAVALSRKDLFTLEVTGVNDAREKMKKAVGSCNCIAMLDILGHGHSQGGRADPSANQYVGSVNAKESAGYNDENAMVVWGGVSTLLPWVSWKSRGMDILQGVHFCRPCTIRLLGCLIAREPAGLEMMKVIGAKTGCEVQGYDHTMLSGKDIPDKPPAEGEKLPPNMQPPPNITVNKPPW